MDIRPSVVLLLRIVLIQLLAAKPNKPIIYLLKLRSVHYWVVSLRVSGCYCHDVWQWLDQCHRHRIWLRHYIRLQRAPAWVVAEPPTDHCNALTTHLSYSLRRATVMVGYEIVVARSLTFDPDYAHSLQQFYHFQLIMGRMVPAAWRGARPLGNWYTWISINSSRFATEWSDWHRYPDNEEDNAIGVCLSVVV